MTDTIYPTTLAMNLRSKAALITLEQVKYLGEEITAEQVRRDLKLSTLCREMGSNASTIRRLKEGGEVRGFLIKRALLWLSDSYLEPGA